MPTFRTVTIPPNEAPAFEATLLSQGYRERVGASGAVLLVREYIKRTAGSNPNTFGGQQMVTFEIRD